MTNSDGLLSTCLEFYLTSRNQGTKITKFHQISIMHLQKSILPFHWTWCYPTPHFRLLQSFKYKINFWNKKDLTWMTFHLAIFKVTLGGDFQTVKNPLTLVIEFCTTIFAHFTVHVLTSFHGFYPRRASEKYRTLLTTSKGAKNLPVDFRK